MGRVQHQKVLMIVLSGVEAGERLKLCDDRLWKNMGLIKLGDIGVGYAFLIIVGVEDG